MLSFQGLDVYRRAIEFLALVYDVVDDLPKGHMQRADPLTRAAESVCETTPRARDAGRRPMRPSITRLPVVKLWNARHRWMS
jgi:hypothetical protein